MILKNLAIRSALLAVALVPVALAGQTVNPAVHPGTSSQAAVSPAATPGTSTAGQLDCESGSCQASTPHISIATPAPAPAPWPWQERIAWAASLILTLIAYVGIMLAVSLLRKIDRQTRYAETAAQAAADSAKAALDLAQAQTRAERPWILVSAEREPGAPDSFNVVAVNRGRGPARIVSLVEGIAFAKDETALPADPAYKESESPAPVAAMVLLPGENTSIKSFRRDEASAVCKTPEQLNRVENWEERIYLYGKVTYIDLQSTDEKQTHETAWCCWYIHGRQKSGMVMAGKPPYNQHS